jgi:hypothetical protein
MNKNLLNRPWEKQNNSPKKQQQKTNKQTKKEKTRM